MSEVTKFTEITDDFISKNRVRALANYPNRSSSYGQAGLSADALKAWFDNLSMKLIECVKEIQEALNSSDAPKYIGVQNYGTLEDIITSFANGDFANNTLMLNKSVGEGAPVSLQSIINSVAKEISELEADKLNKYSGDSFENGQIYKVYAVDKSGTDKYLVISGSASENEIPIYQTDGALPVGTPSEEDHATPKSYVDSKIREKILDKEAIIKIVKESFSSAEGGEF